jgi:hypothetical protein
MEYMIGVFLGIFLSWDDFDQLFYTMKLMSLKQQPTFHFIPRSVFPCCDLELIAEKTPQSLILIFSSDVATNTYQGLRLAGYPNPNPQVLAYKSEPETSQNQSTRGFLLSSYTLCKIF